MGLSSELMSGVGGLAKKTSTVRPAIQGALWERVGAGGGGTAFWMDNFSVSRAKHARRNFLTLDGIKRRQRSKEAPKSRLSLFFLFFAGVQYAALHQKPRGTIITVTLSKIFPQKKNCAVPTAVPELRYLPRYRSCGTYRGTAGLRYRYRDTAVPRYRGLKTPVPRKPWTRSHSLPQPSVR